MTSGTSAPDVVLHIGAMKSGTSFVQSVLGRNLSALTEMDVLWVDWFQQRDAVEELMAARRQRGDGSPRWDELAARVRDYSGRSIISMEFLSFAGAGVARYAVESLAPRRVRVVLTVRDLARVLPAQWQETTQNRRSWTYRQYLHEVSRFGSMRTACGAHFWHRHYWPTILRRWGAHVAPEDLVLVTVPPRGAAPCVLWERFVRAAGIEAADVSLAGFDNDSLGAASAELMRRVSQHAVDKALTADEYRILKTLLAKRVLVERRHEEPALVLPMRSHGWARRKTSRMLRHVRKISPHVIGDLDDLRPQFEPAGSRRVTEDPSALTSSEVLDAALDGVAGLARALPGRHR